ncbi:hypothetical protein RhiirA1_541015 [Rhizophagus irregularis]|uniref:Uncharacterized protein n=1 Tax=Rhizophagus irregularis TaxID=588596 RepID=A0A2N0R5G5_9GLOM|nr:hypothetical protein RhiirA1_541015 [Rhizophagus irregularis]
MLRNINLAVIDYWDKDPNDWEDGIAKSDENKKIWDTKYQIASLAMESELTSKELEVERAKETQIESDINEEMDEDSCKLEKTDNYKSKKVETDSEKRILVFLLGSQKMNETRFSHSYFPQHFANRSEESKWQKSKENDIYELERALFPMELLCQSSHQESNFQETKGISLMEPGSFEETVHKDRTKKSIPSIYDKPYTQQNKEIQAQSFSLPITSETARNNEIKCKRTKSGSKDEVREYDDILRDNSCPNRARIESIQASMGKLCRIGVVGSDERTKWVSCRFVQPCYRIGRDCTEIPLHNVSEGHECCNNSSMVIEIIASESNRHQLAESVNQGPCEVSSLTECMRVKMGYGPDLYDIAMVEFLS